MIVGIDYGNKLSGTTVIAVSENHDQIKLLRSPVKKDADNFILDFIRNYSPEEIFIDAPLSLPGIYTGILECNDYFFREADKVLRAMSPMFLGGLTARAIRLRDMGQLMSVRFFETYPRYLASILNLEKYGYKKSINNIERLGMIICSRMGKKVDKLSTWHDIDALLSILAHHRYKKGESERYGIPEEGLVYV